MSEPMEKSETPEVVVKDLDGPLEDLYTLFRDQDQEFRLETVSMEDEDPDEDIEDDEDIEIEGRETLKDLLPPTILYILEDIFGPEWYSLEAPAVLATMADLYTLDEVDLDVIYALQVLASDDSFWTQWDIFNWCTQALDGVPANFAAFDMPTIPHMIDAMITASVVLESNNDTASYSPEVLSYIAVACLEEGYWELPTPLDVVQKRVDELLLQRSFKPPRQQVLDRASEIRDKKTVDDDEITAQAKNYLFLQEYGRDFLEETHQEILAYQKSNK